MRACALIIIMLELFLMGFLDDYVVTFISSNARLQVPMGPDTSPISRIKESLRLTKLSRRFALNVAYSVLFPSLLKP